MPLHAKDPDTISRTACYRRMERRPVTSSTVRSIGYDPELRVLEIEFLSGEVYRYLNVPTKLYEEFVQASSFGRFFNEHIRGRYAYARNGYNKTMSNKEIAIAFLSDVTKGDIETAYEKYVAKNFRHHNMYFKGDRASLMKGMKENESRFPNKKFELLRAVAEGDLVITYSRVRLDEKMPEIVVVHICRFEGEKIVEMWDVGQQIQPDSPNENGVF